ncbi:MAG TPA: putative quinol monooxygenase [Microlunatus sp.]
MTTPTDDRPELLTVIANMRAKPGKEQELRAALEALIERTVAEAGYVNYDLHQGVEDPAVFFFYENWESADHLDAHLSAPHLQEFSARLDELLDGELRIERLRRIA